MDRKAIVAVVLCVAVLLFYRPLLGLLGLDHFLEPPRQTPLQTSAPPSDSLQSPEAAALQPLPATMPADPHRSVLGSAPSLPSPAAAIERTTTLETPLYRATFTNHGARLLAVEIKGYASAHGVSSAGGKPKRHRGEVPPGDRVTLAGGPLVALDLGSGDALRSLEGMAYQIVETPAGNGAQQSLTFVGEDSSGFRVRQTYRVRPNDYAIDLEVEMAGAETAWRASEYSIATRSWPLVTEVDTVQDARALRATSLVGTNLRREQLGGLLKGAKRFEGNAQWAAVQNRYFLCAVAAVDGPTRSVLSTGERRVLTDRERRFLPPGGRLQQEVVSNALVIGVPAASKPVHKFVLYIGPCEYFRLSALKVRLERAVDMGWAWVLPVSTALLKTLNWLYGLVRNYGLAILALATLVRLLLHPLNMMSMKSMRSMQRLQPELERIRAKYKGDAQAMNTAVMALYKENKVNPAGGCLPMLLQMPLFIALYQVLFNAIELRQAPFVAWIDDLSAPDHVMAIAGFPIRVLPLLMTGAGLLAQKVTPTDPRQVQTMYIVNVMMLVFFYNLPSGLVLYWTIMNALTALQQWMVLRQDGDPAASSVTVVEAPVQKKRKHAGGSR